MCWKYIRIIYFSTMLPPAPNTQKGILLTINCWEHWHRPIKALFTCDWAVYKAMHLDVSKWCEQLNHCFLNLAVANSHFAHLVCSLQFSWVNAVTLSVCNLQLSKFHFHLKSLCELFLFMLYGLHAKSYVIMLMCFCICVPRLHLFWQ